MKGFVGAVSFLTRIPARTSADLNAAIAWIPVVGAFIGAAIGGVYALMRGALTPLPAAAIAVGCGIVLTGALHEDGLADVADGFGAGGARERIVQIMHDPRTGSYGALALILSVLLRVSLIGTLSVRVALVGLPVAHALSRATAVVALRVMPSAPGSALGAAYRNAASRAGAIVAASIGIVVATALLGIWALSATAVSVLVAALVGLMAVRKIGGATGDTLGATQQLAEIAILVVVVAARHTVVPAWLR